MHPQGTCSPGGSLAYIRGMAVLCPSCHRIIYWDKLMEDPDGRASDDDKEGPTARE